MVGTEALGEYLASRTGGVAAGASLEVSPLPAAEAASASVPFCVSLEGGVGRGETKPWSVSSCFPGKVSPPTGLPGKLLSFCLN